MECLKKGGVPVLESLVRLSDVSFDMGVVPMNWHCTKRKVTNVNVATQEVLVCRVF